MTVSFDTFERYKQKGLDARRAGQWDTAKHYLLKAAQAILELNKSVLDPELKQARRERAEKLFQLAKDCDPEGVQVLLNAWESSVQVAKKKASVR